MTISELLKRLLIVVLLSSLSARATEQTIVEAIEEGKQIATFTVGNSRCVLKDDQIRCVVVNIK
jgi:hypothetical protein